MISMRNEKQASAGSAGKDMHIGPYVRHLSKSIRISIDEALDQELSSTGETRLTSVQAHVMGYLNMQHELGNVVYQKDIEQVFHIQRSTATGILKLLEQRGSIRRVCEEKDARMKRIEVTEQARHTKKRIDSTIERVEKKLVTGLSDEEIRTYIELTEKMRRNLET